VFRTIGIHGSSIRGRSATLSTSPDSSTTGHAPPRGGPPRRGLRARLRERAITRIPYQLLVALAGAAVIALGVVLLPLPGPGWLVIFLGLGIWASEFRWAARLLRWVRARVLAWTRWLTRRAPLTQALIGLGLVVVVAGVLATSYVLLYGVPAWLPDWVPLAD
jgi:uncharacterized protein (TIGR02611 family)